ncbi:MAG: UDP-N-acetylglucosamine 1-carboxyvinyltransferase [Clostridiales bacterium]|nr:UDP-N-acetylglucosamine 1-carboxyvinyltransferase [Clostridiales bacterium]
MASLIVTGGVPLSGTARVSGAKNAALPILAASLLARSPILLYDCPQLRDVENMLSILAALGVKNERSGGTLLLDASCADAYVMPQGLSKALRSSIFMLGPLIARFGNAVCTFPGGCEIGHRPIDLHLRGLSMLGVRIKEEHGLILCDGSDLSGADIHLDYPSVGATENIMMAAVAAKGDTVIRNAAREPEIEDLAVFLRKLGCGIAGEGTSTVYIRGGMEKTDPRAVISHRVMSDRIVAGTLLCAAAMTGGEIALENARATHVASALAKLREAGCSVDTGEERIYLRGPKRLREIKLIETLPYPGFPTDLQAQFFALCTMAEGTSIIVENVFENRFKHGPELLRMGASYTQKDRTVILRGVPRLMGARVAARDLRGGAALTLAGLAAEGETVIENAELIDRGYESLENTFSALGARIRRENGDTKEEP